MSTQVTVTLPENVMRQAEFLAQRTGREIEDILSETIELSLRPLATNSWREKPIASWSDEQVLNAADSEMSLEENRKFSDLLDRQQAGNLTSEERNELMGLLQVYQDGLLQKAQGLRESVRRGLREPLRP